MKTENTTHVTAHTEFVEADGIRFAHRRFGENTGTTGRLRHRGSRGRLPQEGWLARQIIGASSRSTRAGSVLRATCGELASVL